MAKPNRKEIYSYEAETAVLSCVFGGTVRGEVEVLDNIFAKADAEDFYSVANKTIFTVMKALHTANKSPDFVLVTDALEDSGEMAKIGGISYLSKLASDFVSTAAYQEYLGIVLELSKRRQVLQTGSYLISLAESGKGSEEVLREAEQLISDISEQRVANDVEHIREPNKAEVERIKGLLEGKRDEFGLATGFPMLDYTLWGLQKSDMVVVAARPGAGKSAFAVNVLKHAAIDKKKNCLFFSLEMPKSQIIRRMYSLICGIDNYTFKSGKGLDEKRNELNEAFKLINNSSLYIDDQSNITVAEMLIKARRFKRKSQLDLVVIDYLQFVKPGRNMNNRTAEVGEIARDIKNLARKLDVPVLALAQLNRERDKDSKLPVLADLRESGEIENNSDIIMFLHSRSGREEPVKDIDVIIGKFRNGQMRSIPFKYTGEFFKFEEAAAVAAEGEKPKPKSKEKEKVTVDTLLPVDNDEINNIFGD